MSTRKPRKTLSSTRKTPTKRPQTKRGAKSVTEKTAKQPKVMEPLPGWDSIRVGRMQIEDLEQAGTQITTGMRTLVDYVEGEDFKVTVSDPEESLQEWDEAAATLTDSFMTMASEMVRLASNGHGDCTGAVWSVAKQFAEAVSDLTFDKKAARVLEAHARRSLFLPSLRARPVGFTHNFQVIADALHLSEDCICHMSDSAVHKLDAPITRLVAEIVESIGMTQQSMRERLDQFRRQKQWYSRPGAFDHMQEEHAVQARKILAMPEAEYLTESHSRRGDDIQFVDLPPLTKTTAGEWWTKAVRKAIVDRYPTLKGTRLHESLNGHKDHEKLDDFRRRAKSALQSLAPQAPRPS